MQADDIFLRGDANGDGIRSLADAAYALRYLFAGGVAPDCLDAADTDDSAMLTIGDAIYNLNNIFAGAPAPPPPVEAPGPDPTADGLTCKDGLVREPTHDPGQRIVIGSARGIPGDVVDVRLLVTNTADAEGFQVTIAYDEQALVKGDAVFAQVGGERAGFRIARVQAPGILKVGFLVNFEMRPDRQIKSGADVELVTLRFRIEADAAPGLYPLAVVRDNGWGEISEQGLSIVPLLLDGGIAVASAAVGAPYDAACARRDGGADITWKNGDTYDEIRILRDGEPLATLPDRPSSFRDAVVDATQHGYLIYGVKGGAVSSAASCSVPGPLGEQPLVPAPRVLACETRLPEIRVVLSWTNAAAYDAVRIWRNGELVAELPGTTEGWTDAVGTPGRLTYWVAGVVGGNESSRAVCSGGAWNNPPDALRCSVLDGPAAHLEWVDPQSYDEIRVYRDGTLIATLPGGATEYLDVGPLAPGVKVYVVESIRAGMDPASSSCSVEVLQQTPGAPFLRGDANTDGVLTIADACFELSYMFAGTEVPDCIDAADTDDSGMLTIGDSILLLNHLFAGAPSPPPPAGAPGADPTPDTMSCDAGTTRQAVRLDSERLALGIARAVPGTAVAVPVKITNASAVQGFQCEFTFDERALTLGEIEPAAPLKVGYRRLSVVGPGRARIGFVWDLQMAPGDLLGPGADQAVARIQVSVAAGAAPSVFPLAFVRGGRENELSEGGISVIPSLEDGGIVAAESEIAPPRNLACAAQGAEIVLAWTNGEAYDRIIVLRNASKIAELAGTATALRDPDPGPIAVYWVYGVRGGDPSAPARCSVGEGVIPGPADLACALDMGTWDVTLAWTNPTEYDGIEILRNGVVLAKLPGDALSYADLGVAAADFVYVVAGIIDGIRSEPAFCHVGTTVAPPIRLACEMRADCDVSLTWANADDYDAIRIGRNGETLAEIAGDAASYRDTECLPIGKTTYEVIGIRGPFASTAASCTVDNKGPVDPVIGLSCSASDTETRLTWTNRDAYDEIVISRDGTDIAVLPGDGQEYVGEPVTSNVVFGVRGRIGGVDGPVHTCKVNGGILFAAGDVVLSGPDDRQPCPISLTCEMKTQGFSFGLAHDAAVVRVADVTWRGTVLEPMHGGTGPGWFRWNQYDKPLTGITAGAVFDFEGFERLAGSAAPRTVMQVFYEPAEGAQPGDSCALAFTDLLGSPPVNTVVVSGGESLRPRLESGSATIGGGEAHFKRGDCNDDGSLDIGDPISILNYLFASGRAPACLDWADANDDGRVDVADPIFLAIYVTGGGASLKSPVNECGPDPTEDELPPCTVPSSSCRQ